MRETATKILFGGVLMAVGAATMAIAWPDYDMLREEGRDSTMNLTITGLGGAVILAGLILLLIGVIGEGVRAGNRES